MSKRSLSRSKIVRKFGENIFGNPKFDKILAKKPYAPGQHGKKFRRRLSSYGEQLKEKQKLKACYGVRERQFRNYYQKARKTQEATGEKLLQILESRLDNIVYRAGFAPTRPAARQLISHGHILVENKKVNVPSFLVQVNQVVSINSKGQQIGFVLELLNKKDVNIPKWLERKATAVKVKRLSERKEIDLNIQEQLIIEYYSR